MSNGNYRMARLIKWFTDSKYHHISIAIDLSEDLELYSMSVKENALIRENMGEFGDRDFKIAIWSFNVGVENKRYARETLERMIANPAKYSMLSILKLVVRNAVGLLGSYNTDAVDRTELICSEFAVGILKAGGVDVKDLPTIPSPNDIFRIPDRQFIFQGHARNFKKLYRNYIARQGLKK